MYQETLKEHIEVTLVYRLSQPIFKASYHATIGLIMNKCPNSLKFEAIEAF